MENIYEYTPEQVGNELFIDMHVRGDSTKEIVDTNTKLMIFFVHGNSLYSWTMFQSHSSSQQNQENSSRENEEVLKPICSIDSKIYLHDDSTLFFLENIMDEDGNIMEQQINQIKIGFSFAVITVAYKQRSSREQIISINVDQIKRFLIIISKVWSDYDKAYKLR